MNSYVDAILKCIFDHAENRRIIFSCFDAGMCFGIAHTHEESHNNENS